MNVNWIDTRTIYRSMIKSTNDAERSKIFTSCILEPWQQLMSMVQGTPGAAANDPFAAARAWHWLVPEQLVEPPDSLLRLEAANAWETGAAAMEMAVKRFEPFADRIPIDTIEGWLILADPQTSDPISRGYTGAVDFFAPRFVVQFSEPNSYNLPRLGGCVVHELHHLIRTKAVPWNIMEATVADYIVHEGLAESFAAACFGEGVVGYYVTDFDEAQIDTARALVGQNLSTTGFDKLRGFIFGDYWAGKMGFPAVGMPDYGGYAIGYRVVQAYLQRTGSSIEEATFVSAADIVAESGYFE